MIFKQRKEKTEIDKEKEMEDDFKGKRKGKLKWIEWKKWWKSKGKVGEMNGNKWWMKVRGRKRKGEINKGKEVVCDINGKKMEG